MRKYVWVFRANKHFSMNATITKLSFIYFDLQDCNLGSLIFYSYRGDESMNSFRFCGKFSGAVVTYYSKFPFVQMIVSALLLANLDVQVDFSVMDSGVVFSVGFIHRTEKIGVWNECVKEKIMDVQYFSVMGRKHEHIEIRIRGQPVDSLLHDGPGKLSPLVLPIGRLSPNSNYDSTLMNSTLYQTTSFQCLLVLITMQNEHHVQVTYPANNKSTQMIDSTKHLSFPEIETHLSPQIVEISLVRSSLRIYLSIDNLSHSGENNQFCSYAGFTSSRLPSHEEISSICFFQNGYNSRHIYSDGPQMLLIVYSFAGYASVGVSLTVMTTQCKPVPINTCLMSYSCRASGEQCNFIKRHPNIDGPCLGDPFCSKGTFFSLLNEKCLVLQLNHSMKQFSFQKTIWGEGSRTCFTKDIQHLFLNKPGFKITFHVTGFFSGL